MTNTKFTPGPWRHSKSSNFGNLVQAYSGKTGEYDDGWRTVATVQACCASNNYVDENENQQANIDLILTAPELYDAFFWVENGIPAECFDDDESVPVYFSGKTLKHFAKLRRKARGQKE